MNKIIILQDSANNEVKTINQTLKVTLKNCKNTIHKIIPLNPYAGGPMIA
ncbi:hypothetical protein GS399_16490 [Pedobacter sp. HMF7647]|uniref:Uncharacterized protein n=1 Tax=Hufsiella arboris TaxID=2695275 RepID=A0A7K1YDA7_9SPHI|nr:hypothetical protein [Hufsiella arboris]MXV52573.1 hypothetical protein [Hufsiella arboris]